MGGGYAPRTRSAVIAARDGERRLLRGGTAPLLIKVDPITTGSERLVAGRSDLPPGDDIALHRHLREDEIIIITRGTGLVRLGQHTYTAGPNAMVFIPQGTCIALTNAGLDTLTNFFIFSSPGFERVLREVSAPPDSAPRRVTPAQRSEIFGHGHAVASPGDC